MGEPMRQVTCTVAILKFIPVMPPFDYHDMSSFLRNVNGGQLVDSKSLNSHPRLKKKLDVKVNLSKDR